MILIKCLGAALVVISGCGLGLQLAGQWRGRLALLEQLRKMIHLLKGEIVYANSTLEEALCRVGSRTDGGLGKMFSSAGEEISRQTGESLKEIWERQVESLGKDCLLAKEDRKALALSLIHISWEHGIYTRAGGHCAPLMHGALGTREQGAVRFSFSHFNTDEEVETAAAALRSYIE